MIAYGQEVYNHLIYSPNFSLARLRKVGGLIFLVKIASCRLRERKRGEDGSVLP
jgi:hypothetical protein